MQRDAEESLLRRILLATDCSSSAAAAAAYSFSLAKRLKARVDIVHAHSRDQSGEKPEGAARAGIVQKPPPLSREMSALVERAEEQGIDATGYEREGQPGPVILALARTLACDLVMMGTHGRKGISHVFLGSTAEDVIRSAPCPVLTVRGHRPVDLDESGPLPDFPHIILVPFDFSPCALAAWDYAVRLARASQGSLTVLHVMEASSYGLDFTLTHLGADRRRRQRIMTGLAELVERSQSRQVSARAAIQEGGRPAEGILEHARGANTDLIVIGTHGRRGLSHAMTGSVAEAVVREASCPVLTVRNGSPKRDPVHAERSL